MSDRETKELGKLNQELINLNTKIDALDRKRDRILTKIRRYRIREVHSRN